MLAKWKVKTTLFGASAERVSSSFCPKSQHLRKEKLKWGKGEIWWCFLWCKLRGRIPWFTAFQTLPRMGILWRPYWKCRFSLVKSGWGLALCISNQLRGDVFVDDMGPMLWDARLYWHASRAAVLNLGFSLETPGKLLKNAQVSPEIYYEFRNHGMGPRRQ